MTRRQAEDELPLSQALAFAAWNMETAPYSSAQRVSPGYVSQEFEGLYEP